MLACSPNRASSRERSHFCMLDHLLSSRVTGPVVLPSRRHGTAIAGTAGGVRAHRPPGQPRCTTPHSSPPKINACPHTHTPRPKRKEKKKRNPQRKREGGVAPNRTAPFSLCPAGNDPPGHDDKPCTGGERAGDRKPTFRLNAVPE